VGRRREGRPRKGAPLLITAPTARPEYDGTTELRIAVLDVLAAKMAYAARRGDVPGWCLARCWAEVALYWWADQ
jgi:hypothetical protein